MSEQPQQAPIQRVSYHPSDPNSGRQRIPLWQWALAGLLMLVLVTLWFLFTAKSIALSFSPKAEEISIQGGIHLKLGNIFLMREGTYTIAARAQEHKPLQQSLRVSAAANQSFQYSFTKSGRHKPHSSPQRCAGFC